MSVPSKSGSNISTTTMRVALFCSLLFLTVVGVDQATGSSSWIHTPLNGWYKYACSAENIKLSKTYYCDHNGKILCLPGWTDESTLCQVPLCEINGQTCVHGNCSKPLTCDCEVGWTGQFCEKCVCLPGCVNGYCNNSLECICRPGWEGMFCDKPVCDGCVHGECAMPGMCVCNPGWSGPNCTVCESRDDCLFGRCINEPFECACYDGYYGEACENPICREGCNKANGFCMMPETCICKAGWTGPNCTECIPYWNCQHGTCNKPWECICDPGYFGLECNETKTVNGSWGLWSSFTTCSVTCGQGVQIRTRHCDNPPKSGNGTYCSVDGSSSKDTRSCNLGPCGGTNVTSTSTTTSTSTPTSTTPSTIPPINGNWGAWTAFSACSVTCGNGTRIRTRACNNPPPSQGGLRCPGDFNRTDNCPTNPSCPIDGNYTTWTQWSPCTVECIGDNGDSTRRRYCTNPTPAFGGKNCTDLGVDKETRNCTGTIPRQSSDPTIDCFTIFA